MKKNQSTDMQATVQRRFVQPESEISPSTAIPRSTEFDLIPDPRGGECSFMQESRVTQCGRRRIGHDQIVGTTDSYRQSAQPLFGDKFLLRLSAI